MIREQLAEVLLVGGPGLRPDEDSRVAAVAGLLRERAPERVRDGIHALDLASDPLQFALGLVVLGDVKAAVVGPSASGPALEDAARWILGLEEEPGPLPALSYLATADDRLLTVAAPGGRGPAAPRTLAELAVRAAEHRSRVLDDPPRVGILLPSTDTPLEETGEQILAELAAIGPGIPASIDREVRLGPVPGPGSPEARFRGRANILIFPDPASGHIACGFAREFGRVRVLGPIYLGAEGAVAGLSESADADDIVAAAALAALGRTGL